MSSLENSYYNCQCYINLIYWVPSRYVLVDKDYVCPHHSSSFKYANILLWIKIGRFLSQQIFVKSWHLLIISYAHSLPTIRMMKIMNIYSGKTKYAYTSFLSLTYSLFEEYIWPDTLYLCVDELHAYSRTYTHTPICMFINLKRSDKFIDIDVSILV